MKYEIKKLYEEIINKADECADKFLADQVVDEKRPDFGGLFMKNEGYTTACHTETTKLAAVLGCCYFSNNSKYYNDDNIKNKLVYALDFIKRQIRDSGLIDLRCNNYDSPPDTAFMINQLAYPAYMAKKSDLEFAKDIYLRIIDIIIPCAKSVAEGGFHTPNHRWVVCSALAQVMDLEPDLCDFSDIMECYFAETIDFNDEGFYSEKSIGVYDTIVNTRFIILAECYNGMQYKKSDFINMVEKNLNTRLDFMNNDYTMDTSISTRQDFGKTYYLACFNSFLYIALEKNNSEFAKAAITAFNKPIKAFAQDLCAAIYFFSRHPEWKEKIVELGELRTECDRFMPKTGIYRVKDGKMTATAQIESAEFLNIRNGGVTLAGVRVLLSYFGGARYKANKIYAIDNGVELHFYSEHNVSSHPAYWMPLGRPVSESELPFNNVPDRELKKRPAFNMSVKIIRTQSGFDLHIKTENGMNGVRFSTEFLFVPNGRIETDNMSFGMQKDETLFLKEGSVMVVNNDDFIRIDGGFYSHRALSMNDGTNGLYRIVLTDFSPIDRVIHIECGQWSEKDGKCYAEKLYNN